MVAAILLSFASAACAAGLPAEPAKRRPQRMHVNDAPQPLAFGALLDAIAEGFAKGCHPAFFGRSATFQLILWSACPLAGSQPGS
jgi:hypothetical protein